MTMMASHRDGEMVYIIYMLVIMSASAPIISAVSLTGKSFSSLISLPFSGILLSPNVTHM